jgi:type I restriction enzyme S subunit
MSAPAQATWPEVRIGDVLTYLDERIALDDSAEYITITIKRRHGGLEERERLLGHQIKSKKQFRLIPGAFIISRVQCWHEAYAVVPDNTPTNMIASANYDQYSIRANVDRRFFWWLSHSPNFRETVRNSAFGVVIEKMVFDREAWLEKKISLPPLAEQQRIVARVEELAVRVSEASALCRQAEQETEALTKSQTSHVFDDLTHHHKAAIRTLGVRGENPVQTGPFGAQLHASEFVEEGVPVLNVGNVWPDGLRLDWLDHVLPEMAEQLSRYSLRTGDLLFARSGATLGKVCLVPDECNDWLMTGHLFRVRFDQKRIYNRFAFAAFRGSRSVHEQVFGQIRGATRPGYNTTLLGNVELPVPPLSEQHRIVAYLDELQAKKDTLKALQAETSKEIEALMPSILDKAFRGEL